MHTVLCAVAICLAGILHVLETYRYYRQGFEEGEEKGHKTGYEEGYKKALEEVEHDKNHKVGYTSEIRVR